MTLTKDEIFFISEWTTRGNEWSSLLHPRRDVKKANKLVRLGYMDKKLYPGADYFDYRATTKGKKIVNTLFKKC